MACPFCGYSESAVIRSRGAVATDQVRRRRECAGCGRRFPSYERVDRAQLEREIGVDAMQLVASLLQSQQAPTWQHVEQLLERLRAQAVDQQFVEADWRGLLDAVASLRDPAPDVPRDPDA